MFGAIVEYFFSGILGIKRFNDNAGYTEIEIKPANISKLRNVKGSMKTKWGEITVSITTDENGKRDVKTEVTGDISIK